MCLVLLCLKIYNSSFYCINWIKSTKTWIILNNFTFFLKSYCKIIEHKKFDWQYWKAVIAIFESNPNFDAIWLNDHTFWPS